MTHADVKRTVSMDSAPQLFAQWFALLFPAAVFLVHLQLAYTMVSWACAHGTLPSLHLVSGAAVLLAAFGAFFAWRHHRALSGGLEAPTVRSLERARFLSACGIALGTMFTLVLLWQFIAEFFFTPCQ